MKEVRQFIKDNKSIYRDILDEYTFSLLFSNKLPPDKIPDLQDHIYERIMTSYCINKYTEKLCNKLTKSVSTFFVSSNNKSNYGRITATSNNIYTKSNVTTELTDNLDISTLFIPYKNTNLIILSNNYVVKHIGIVRTNIINWNYKLRTYPDVYIQCPPPPDDINKKVISTILLNTLRGDD